jgi:hypothetical protein
MRVVLEIIGGPEKGRSVRLTSREVRQFGRTDWADTSFPYDQKMSQVHFSLETVGKLCRIRDLDCCNGTLVNGEAIVAHVLADGDKIVAGETTFVARIDGGADVADVAAAKTVAAAAAARLPPKKKTAVRYTTEECNTGLTLYRGAVADLSPAHLIDLIGRKLPLYLLVDTRKLPEPPADLPPPQYLFDWLPPDAAAKSSPIILAQTEYADCFALVEQGWGEDALIALYSKTDPQDLRAHLRKQTRSGPDAVLGICWPGVVAPLLQFYKREMAAKLLAGIDAVVVEFPDFPDTWQVFAPAEFRTVLESLGFEEEKPEPVEAGAADPNAKPGK